MPSGADTVAGDRPPRLERRASVAFGALALGLVLARFYKFRAFLDEPHAFRQAWTSGYTQQFYAFDMNIFLPSILSMGNYRHILIEFPLPEWIAALVYHISGPTLLVDRMVSIVFFLGSAFFLFRTAALIADRLFAWVATTIYMAAPLGIYFSRAVHIDSAAMCFGHALLYFFLRYGDTGRRTDLVRAFAASALGMLVKAPYVFYLILPALYVQFSRGRTRRMAVSALVFCGAVGVGLAWYAYAQSINRRAPDLSFVRGYEAAADRVDFYLGAAGRRLSGDEWMTILGRMRREIAVNVWWLVVPLAVIWRRPLREPIRFAAVWTLGSALFLLVFFAANSMHNYYQLNFIAPFALWMAIPLCGALRARDRFAPLWRSLAVAAVVVYAAMGVRFAFERYYAVDALGLRVGRFVWARTTDRDLVIMAYNNAYNFDPRYLYYARRRGWSVHAPWLEPRGIEGLKAHGATTVVTSDIWPAPADTVRYLERQTLLGILNLGDDRHVFLHRID